MVISQKNKVSSQNTLPITNDKMSLERVLSQLNEMASEGKEKRVKLYLTDEIFQRCTVN